MSKKTMLVALLAASATLLALPALATGQEIHLEGISEFADTGVTSSLTAEGEPTFTCESTHVVGTIDAGGTTGSIDLDMTGCHMTFFGLTAKCHSSQSPYDNTVRTNASFHLITYNISPAVLMTPASVTLVCGGFGNVIISGSSIATVISPKCGEVSNRLTFKFTATGAVQDDRLYTGVEHDLKFQTGSGGSFRTAGTSQTWTNESPSKGTLYCT